MFSCSKLVTAAALLILVERGAVKLDDPVAKYLPEYADAVFCRCTGNNLVVKSPCSPMTIKHLVTMTSGLTYGGDANPTQQAVRDGLARLRARGGFSTREFAAEMARAPLAFDPGSHWNYGVGHDVLGALVEAVVGKLFGDFLRESVFKPLNMGDTGFFLSAAHRDRLATLYCHRGGVLTENCDEDYQFTPEYRFESGGGGLLSTLGDMTRFAGMLAMRGTLGGARILGGKSIDLMRQNHLSPAALEDFRTTHRNGWEFMSGYGYGLGAKTLLDLSASNCLGTVGEFSWAGAAGTYILADPEEELAIVYMHQLMPHNREEECHPRVKNTVYSLL